MVRTYTIRIDWLRIGGTVFFGILFGAVSTIAISGLIELLGWIRTLVPSIPEGDFFAIVAIVFGMTIGILLSFYLMKPSKKKDKESK